MTTTTDSPVPAPTTTVTERIKCYQGKLLSPGQKATMLDDIKAAVLRAEPPSADVGGNWLSIVCRLVADVSPAAGGDLSTFLTHATVSTWVSASVRKGQSPHVLATRRGVLDRIIRSSNGGAVRINHGPKVRMSVAPLSSAELSMLREICKERGMPARRGFAAVFGSGLCHPGIVGGRFNVTETGAFLVLDGPRSVPLVADIADLSALHGSMVLDGDFVEVIAAGTDMGRRIDSQVVRQTFRLQAVSQREPMIEVINRHHLTQEGLDSVIHHLAAVDLSSDTQAAAALRG